MFLIWITIVLDRCQFFCLVLIVNPITWLLVLYTCCGYRICLILFCFGLVHLSVCWICCFGHAYDCLVITTLLDLCDFYSWVLNCFFGTSWSLFCLQPLKKGSSLVWIAHFPFPLWLKLTDLMIWIERLREEWNLEMSMNFSTKNFFLKWQD